MTKEEINEHCNEICEWLKQHAVAMPRVYIGELKFKTGASYLDGDFAISIDNSKGFKCKFFDGNRHQTRVEPWELDKCCLEYRVALLKNWKTIKGMIEDLVEECAKKVDAEAEKEAAREKLLCDSITEFTL